MIKIGACDIDKISILAEPRFCQETPYRIGHYGHFDLSKNPSFEYHIAGNLPVLIFNFETKGSNHDIGIICRLVEKEFYLHKSYMKANGWSEYFDVNVKKKEVHSHFSNYYKKFW